MIPDGLIEQLRGSDVAILPGSRELLVAYEEGEDLAYYLFIILCGCAN